MTSPAETWHDRYRRLLRAKDYRGALALLRMPLPPEDHDLPGRPGHTAEGTETRDEQIDPALQTQDAWGWLASRINLELDWGEIEEGEAAWRIHRVSGGRNDREWELIATGTTPLAAVQAARKALPALQTQGAESPDPDLGSIAPGHICKHGVRWPHACGECDDAAFAALTQGADNAAK